MKIRTMLGLAAIGGLLYLHRERGGEWTVDSFKQTARDLWRDITRKAQDIQREAADAVHDTAREAEVAAREVQEATETAPFHS
jgi:hypothetical protein